MGTKPSGISGNEADQAAKDALTEEIDNRETYSPQDLIKWMKKEEAMSRQQRWEKGDNGMRNRKTSASWQNDTAELSRKEQMIISRLRTGYIRATHRHVIEKKWHAELPIRCTTANRPNFMAVWRNTQQKRRMQDPMHSMEGGKKETDWLRQEDRLLPRDLENKTIEKRKM
jgi:hypothetical protein